MPIDLRTIADAPKKALVLIENPEKRLSLEQFLENSGPLVEAAVRDALQDLADEINAQLAPTARLRLVQEGSRVVPEIVTLGEETSKVQTLVIDSDSISKVLVRMPSNVKVLAAEAAQKAGTSLNGWTVSILQRALVSMMEHQQRASRPQNRPGDEADTEPRSAGDDKTGGGSSG